METFKPIHYSAANVALMVMAADLFNPDLPRRLGLTRRQVQMLSDGRKAPTPAVLSLFDLESSGQGYVWRPG